MLKTAYCLFIIIVTVFLSNAIVSADKYTMRERFGVGSYIGSTNPLGLGWYFNWWSGDNNEVLSNYNTHSTDYMPTLAWLSNDGYPGEASKKTCAEWYSFFQSRPNIFKNGTKVIIGNELGFDDNKTFVQNAIEFNSWKTCLKGYNPKIEVGSGATPWTANLTGGIVGREYFRQFLNYLKTNYGNSSLPDFVIQHAYSYIADLNTDISESKKRVQDMRVVMNEFGLRDRDLIVKEVSSSLPTSTAHSIAYMDAIINYYATATNTTTGNPNDGNRLVQKWAWFLSHESEQVLSTSPAWRFNILFDMQNNFAVTPVGYKYKELVDKYVPSSLPCTVQGIKKANFSDNHALAFEGSNVTITGNGVNLSCSSSTCIFSSIPGNKTYQVNITQSFGSKVYSTMCFNYTDCHARDNFSRINSLTRQVYCPAGGFVDLWWGADNGKDLDGNLKVDIDDALLWIKKLFNEGFSSIEYDYNGDGKYTLVDLLSLLSSIFI